MVTMHVLHRSVKGQLVPVLTSNDEVVHRTGKAHTFGYVLIDASTRELTEAKQAIADLLKLDDASTLVWVMVEIAD